ncbi:APC family permease [Nocardioides sp. WV_118_6]|uniref:APC family permease n=1 Tax=Nocardioides simplex TaxID=2045 RepID=UPI00214F9240|nr:APC family permease [Pimelobacter simplex]UUW88850.1 APC family permease [Pimelobacter simplex]UUW98355.1 APC family permease [Pimelobacter simplex]
MTQNHPPANQPTALAAEQQAVLHKTLRRFDIVFLLIAAVVGLETLGQVSTYGAEAFTWALVLAVFFLVPYGLIFAETGAAFSEEGGAYTWVRDAFGRPAAAVAAILTWVTQPVWVGGSMAFLAARTVSTYLTPLEPGSVGDYAFKVVFIWITVLAAIASLRKGKWLPTSGALLKVGLLVFFVLTTIIYAVKHGVVGLSAGDFSPTFLGLCGSVPILLFAYLGFESSNSAAGEMENPARDVPIAIFRSCATAAACYLVPIFAILLVVPKDDITGIGGLLDAVGTVYSVYGGAADALLKITAVGFVYILMSQGAAWMIISDRMQAMTAADGSFFGGFFGRFHPRLGTPVRVNLLSGVVATAFLLVAMQVSGSGASIFGVVLTISISTFLLSYLLVIPAVIRLRTRYPDRPRPFRVPVSDRGFALLGWLAFAWIVLGSWVAVFPGTLERLAGEEYDFVEIWDVSQLTFEAFTLGTLAFLLVLCGVGYVLGAPVRARMAAPVPVSTAPSTSTEETSR